MLCSLVSVNYNASIFTNNYELNMEVTNYIDNQLDAIITVY
jgi:hypothetical protein